MCWLLFARVTGDTQPATRRPPLTTTDWSLWDLAPKPAKNRQQNRPENRGGPGRPGSPPADSGMPNLCGRHPESDSHHRGLALQFTALFGLCWKGSPRRVRVELRYNAILDAPCKATATFRKPRELFTIMLALFNFTPPFPVCNVFDPVFRVCSLNSSLWSGGFLLIHWSGWPRPCCKPCQPLFHSRQVWPAVKDKNYCRVNDGNSSICEQGTGDPSRSVTHHCNSLWYFCIQPTWLRWALTFRFSFSRTGNLHILLLVVYCITDYDY